jgi:hypothetical protein
VPDPSGLDGYVAALEAALTRLRGREVVLSAHDFALARAWQSAGWPVTWVLDEIAGSQARGERPSSLAYLRRRVEARARRSAGVVPPEESGAVAAPPGPDLQDAARAWSRALRSWLLGHGAHGSAVALGARLDAFDAGLTHWTPVEVQAGLAALDTALDETALALCGTERAAGFQREAARAVARQRGRLDDAALEAALARYERRRAREVLGAPERR